MIRLEEQLQNNFKQCKEDAAKYGSGLITTSIFINVLLKEKEQSLMKYFEMLNIKYEEAVLMFAEDLIVDSYIKEDEHQIAFICMGNVQYFLTAELMKIINCAYEKCCNENLDVLKSSDIANALITFMSETVNEEKVCD